MQISWSEYFESCIDTRVIKRSLNTFYFEKTFYKHQPGRVKLYKLSDVSDLVTTDALAMYTEGP
jgi:hypothetical protein